MIALARWQVYSAMVGCLWLALGCSTPTAVSKGSKLQGNDGLVLLRMVDMGDVPISRFTVESEQTGEVYPLRSIRFGQSSTRTYVGRLPAGRYHPKELTGYSGTVNGSYTSLTVPLAQRTGKFDVESGRATQLGTMVFVDLPGGQYDFGTQTRLSNFLLPLDPTPVQVESLLAMRYPEMSKTATGRPPLGWISGTVPAQPAGMLDAVRKVVIGKSQPTFVDNKTLVRGGYLGVMVKTQLGAKSVRVSANTVNAVTAVLALQDGRWLMGGEEGYLATSVNQGQSWQSLPAVSPGEVVIHLVQRSDRSLFMVTDSDREVVVYQSADRPIAWKEIKRIASSREQSFMTRDFIEDANYFPDFAASTDDRLVVYTHSDTLTSLDFKTGQWESHSTPRMFGGGIKVTPDGYVVGIAMQYWIYGSVDYGKTWKRLEAWMHMTEPHFFDKKRGVMLAAELKVSGAQTPYKVRTTKDGGLTWTAGGDVAGRFAFGTPATVTDPFAPKVARLWSDPEGKLLYTTGAYSQYETSTDGGNTWKKD